MIRWKQEQIHRERDARRTKIVALKHEAETLKKQLDRIEKSQQAELEKKYKDTLQQLEKLEAVENKKLTSDKLVTGFDKTVSGVSLATFVLMILRSMTIAHTDSNC